jgi:hypothetical protein
MTKYAFIECACTRAGERERELWLHFRTTSYQPREQEAYDVIVFGTKISIFNII